MFYKWGIIAINLRDTVPVLMDFTVQKDKFQDNSLFLKSLVCSDLAQLRSSN